MEYEIITLNIFPFLNNYYNWKISSNLLTPKCFDNSVIRKGESEAAISKTATKSEQSDSQSPAAINYHNYPKYGRGWKPPSPVYNRVKVYLI